jgi:hypothetical protein
MDGNKMETAWAPKVEGVGNDGGSHRAKLKGGDEKAKNFLGQWILPKDWRLGLDGSAERREKRVKSRIPFCI